LVPQLLLAQTKALPPAGTFAGTWLVTTDLYGLTVAQRLELSQAGGTLTGELDGDKLSGTISGRSVHFVAKGEKGEDSAEYTGTLAGDTITGQAVLTDDEE